MSLTDLFRKKSTVSGDPMDKYRPNESNTTPQQRESYAQVSQIFKEQGFAVVIDQVSGEFLIGRDHGMYEFDDAGVITPQGEIEVRYPKPLSYDGLIHEDLYAALDLRESLESGKFPFTENITHSQLRNELLNAQAEIQYKHTEIINKLLIRLHYSK